MDIVMRLRNVHRDWDPRLTILLEAAEEIEQLRSEIERLLEEIALTHATGGKRNRR